MTAIHNTLVFCELVIEVSYFVILTIQVDSLHCNAGEQTTGSSFKQLNGTGMGSQGPWVSLFPGPRTNKPNDSLGSFIKSLLFITGLDQYFIMLKIVYHKSHRDNFPILLKLLFFLLKKKTKTNVAEYLDTQEKLPMSC